jgi:hypothetical protein
MNVRANTLIETIESQLFTIKNDIEVHKNYFNSFLILLPIIEVMGSYLDSFPVDKMGLSKSRFTKAIKQLFDDKYNALSDELYRLRCSLTHNSIPNERFLLIGANADIHYHFKETLENQIVLHTSEFFNDVSNAFIKLKNGIGVDPQIDASKSNTPYTYINTFIHDKDVIQTTGSTSVVAIQFK